MALRNFKLFAVKTFLLGLLIAVVGKLKQALDRDLKDNTLAYEKISVLDGTALLKWFHINKDTYINTPEIVHVLLYPKVAKQKLNINLDPNIFIDNDEYPNLMVQAFYNQSKQSIVTYRLILYKELSKGLRVILTNANFFASGIIVFEDNPDGEEVIVSNEKGEKTRDSQNN